MNFPKSAIDDFLNFKHQTDAEDIHKPYIKEDLQKHEQNIKNQ